MSTRGEVGSDQGNREQESDPAHARERISGPDSVEKPLDDRAPPEHAATGQGRSRDSPPLQGLRPASVESDQSPPGMTVTPVMSASKVTVRRYSNVAAS